jgi:hypothetical protein
MTGRKLKALAACKKQKTKLVIGKLDRACPATPPLGLSLRATANFAEKCQHPDECEDI